jgi:hypothetical protein
MVCSRCGHENRNCQCKANADALMSFLSDFRAPELLETLAGGSGDGAPSISPGHAPSTSPGHAPSVGLLAPRGGRGLGEQDEPGVVPPPPSRFAPPPGVPGGPPAPPPIDRSAFPRPAPPTDAMPPPPGPMLPPPGHEDWHPPTAEPAPPGHPWQQLRPAEAAPLWPASSSTLGLRHRRHRLRLGLGIGALITVIAASLAAAIIVPRLSRPGVAPIPKSWAPGVEPIAHFVAVTRDLAFKHPVAIDEQSPAAFQTQLNQAGTASTSDVNNIRAALRAFGLLHGDPDMSAAGGGTSDVTAYYLPSRAEIMVEGTSLSPIVQYELAFSLTEALDSQYYDLSHWDSVPGVDSTAVDALDVGDAQRVGGAYVQQMPADSQQLLQQALGGGATGANSEVNDPLAPFDEVNNFASDFGRTFVDAVLASGGVRALNRAFAHPPTTESQVIDPDLYLGGTANAMTIQPSVPSGATILDRGDHLGEAALVEMVGDAAGFNTAWSAFAGWEADTFDAYRSAGRVCVTDVSQFDTSADAARLASVAGQWASAMTDATAAQTGSEVVLQSCDPGAAWNGLTLPQPDSYTVLAERAQLLDALVQQAGDQIPMADLSCASDGVIQQVGVQQFDSLLSQANTNNGWLSDLAAALDQALVSCGWTGSAPVAPQVTQS